METRRRHWIPGVVKGHSSPWENKVWPREQDDPFALSANKQSVQWYSQTLNSTRRLTETRGAACAYH